MEKETAVEWFAKQLYESFTIKGNGRLYDLLLEQAKEMHKQEIENAWEDGHDSFSTRNAEQYFNETFEKL
jgi:hypothetical protein